MQDTHDPFSYLLNEIRAFDAGLREHWEPYQRDHYLDVLLIEEAQEIAWGRHHLTVVHGEPVDEVEAELIDELFAAWEDIAEHCEWARIGGVPDQQLTLTISGEASDYLAARAISCASTANPGHWLLIEGTRPRRRR